MRFSDFLLVSDPGDLEFIVGYTEDENIRISVSDFFGNQIYGSGNPGYIPVFTGTETLGNSQIFQDGSNIVIGGVNAMGYRLAVGGSLYTANGAVINSTVLGADALRVIGGDGDIFVIPNDLGQSISSLRRIIHPPAVLTTESATLGQVNTAISNLEADIDILLDLKVDKTSVGAANGVASLDSGGKVPLSQIPDSIIGQVQYMGTWNAFTNTPTLNPIVPEERGHYYVVSAAGVFGGVDYQIGDWIISNGVIWEKVDNTDAVTSVFGRIGAILALEGDYQAFYPRLSQYYDNPTWINTLAFTKITGVPAFLLENQTITLSGDVTGSGKTSIASTISNNAVSNEKLRDSVGTSVIGRSASTTGDPADIQATTDGHVLLRSAGNLLFGLISGDSISSIDWSKITGTPTTLSGYGITDAYTKTESDNKFVPYTGASSNVNLGSNNITANSFIKAGGTSSQFLKADGSVDTGQYVPTTRSVNAGTGLTGGGNLSSDITIAFDTTWGDNRYAYRTRQLTINGTTYDLSADRTWTVGTVTSIGIIAPLTGGTITSSGIIGITQSGSISDGYLSSTDWNTFNNKQGSLTLTTTGTSGASTLIGNTLNIPQYTDQFVGTVTSVGLSMPSAFNVSNSPITSSGTIAVTAAGTASQYVRGDGTLADFPSGGGGGGSSVSYYLNGSVNQGSFVGNNYYEMSKTPIFGAGTDFVAIADGYVAQFITDAGDPNSLIIPAGNWNFETYFSASSAGGTPSFYVELYKYDGSTFTLIASNSTNPELIAFGTTVNPYFSALAVPETILTVTDRIAIRIYVVTSGRTITLHTENSNLCQIVTTFTRGLTALNGLTAQVQYFQVGTSGTDFNIASATATHTFNLPTASAVNRGALSSADWSTFNSKQNTITLTTTGTSGPATFIGDVLNVPNYTTDLSGYVTLATNQTITGLKTILRSGDVLNFKIGTDTLYGLKVAYNQNELAPSGEATWSFVNTFNNGSGTGLDTTPISFFRGVLVTGQRLVSASVNTNLLDYYGNNPSGRYPIYAYNTGVQQFASSIIVGETTGVVNAITGAISDLPAGVVANFKGRVIGSNAVNSNEFVTLSQATSVSRAAISLTTTGTSGPATYSSVTGVLNIPEYQGGVTSFNTRTGAVTLTSSDVTTALGYTPVTDARTLTINGVTYDLTANRSWTVSVNPSAREIQTYIATASQTTFTVTGGYTVGLVDVFINGVRLTSSDYTATNGTTVVLTVGTMAGNIVDIIKYTSGFTNAVSGTGTANELAYFTGTTTIGSLSTATYPSLTELSYVKGVTSSIQTQLNGKQNTLTNPVTGTGTTNTLPKFTGASTIGNSLFTDDGTNGAFGGANYSVGTSVRTFNISAPLYAGLAFWTNNQLTGDIFSYRVTGNLLINADPLSIFTDTKIGMSIDGTERFAIFSNGNVSIGNSPTDNGAKLQVSGTANFVNTINPLILRSTNATTMWTEYYYNTSTLSGYIGSGTGLIGGANASDFIIRSEADLVFASSGGNRRLTIASTGAATFSSSVGIGGATSTNGFLEVWKSGSSIAQLSIGQNSTYHTDFFIDASGNFYIQPQGTTRLTISASTGAATFSSSVTTGSTLQANGNAFILPTLIGGGAGGGLYLGVYPDTQYTKQAILVERYVGVLGNYGRGSLHFCNRDTADANQPTLADSRMVITSVGNVGINTSSPVTYGTRNLEVNGGAGAAYIVARGSNNAGIIEMAFDGAGYIGTKSAHDLVIRTSDVQRINIFASSGNVLIGTGSDNGNKFQVNGSGSFSGGVSASGVSGYSITATGPGANGISDGPFHRYVNTTNSYQILKQINANTDEDTWAYRGSWNKIGTLNAVSGVYTALSDRNKKKDFEDSTIGLNAILGLKPTLYRMLDEDDSVKKQLGFIAQEVKDYIPQACVEQDNFIGLQDRPIVAALVKAVQELKAELDELKGNN